MEKYLGVKLIQATPKSRYKDVDYENCLLKNKQEGYKVVYPDGYESWSPKEIFEEAYRRIDNLTFGLAIEALKKGYKVARKGWNGKNMWLRYIEPYNNNQYHVAELVDLDGTLLPYIAMKTADNGLVPWLASQTDVLAEDWIIIE